MSTIREIPGFYYDEERRRYFKITNGAIPQGSSSSSSLSSLSKYHNNSIQAEQRKKQSTTQKVTKPGKSSKEIIKNPKLDKVSSRLRSKYLTKSTTKFNRFSYTPAGLINFKTGSCTGNNDLLQSRLISSPILKPQYLPMLTPRGYVLCQSNDLLIISRIEGITRNMKSTRYEYYPRSLVVQHTKDGSITELKNYWKVVQGTHVESLDLGSYYEILGIDDSRMDVFHEIMENKQVVVISLYTHYLQGNANSIIRINAIDPKSGDTTHEDYTLKFISFLRDSFQGLPKNTKNQLYKAFGIPLCFMVDDLHEISISEINKAMQSPSSKNTTKIIDFLLLQDVSQIRDKIIYKNENYDNPKGVRILDCQISKNHTIHFLVSNGSLISLKFKHGKFSKFKHVQLNNNMSLNSQLCIHEKIKLVKSGNKLITVDNHGNIRFLDGKFNYIRKIFLISSNEIILILKDTIMYWNITTNEKQVILKYLNDNDVNQQFEIFDGYMLYNVGDTLNIINIHTNESSTIDFQFQFKKCGYLKNFKLVKIVKLAEINTRLHLGFTFLNSEELTTIFETFLI